MVPCKEYVQVRFACQIAHRDWMKRRNMIGLNRMEAGKRLDSLCLPCLN